MKNNDFKINSNPATKQQYFTVAICFVGGIIILINYNLTKRPCRVGSLCPTANQDVYLNNLIAREEAKNQKLSNEELDEFVEECKEKYGHLFTTAYWKSNPDWYDYDENDEPYLTVLAPPEAQASFKMCMDKLKKSIETGILYD